MNKNINPKIKNKCKLVILKNDKKATPEETNYMQAKFVCKLIEWSSKK